MLIGLFETIYRLFISQSLYHCEILKKMNINMNTYLQEQALVSIDPVCKDDNARFLMVHLKGCLIKYELEINVFCFFKPFSCICISCF